MNSSDTSAEIIELPDGSRVLIPGDLAEENKTVIRRLAEAEQARQLTGIIRVDTRSQLRKVARALCVRENWHEPDEQGVTVRVHGSDFDNAGFWGYGSDGKPVAYGDPARQELWIELIQDGRPVAAVNLATLLAFATGWEGLT